MNPEQPNRTIDDRLDAITQTLEAINRKLDYVVGRLGSGEQGECQTLIDGAEEGNFIEAEEAEFEAERTRGFATWSKEEETKGRPKEELTFANFVKESAKGKQ